MLKYEQHVPSDARDGAPLVVLLHGRGSDRFDLLGLAPVLAPRAVVVTPEAPWPGMPWGYGPGWAWYRFMGRNVPEPESFERSQRELAAFLGEIRGRLPVSTGPLVLGGFSQGGVMSMAYALRNPGAAPIILNFSGFLADHPTVRPTAESVAGTRFFWGHGTMDPSIPFDLVVAAAGWFVAGAGMGLLFPRISTIVLAHSSVGNQGFNTSAMSIADNAGSSTVIAFAGLAFTASSNGFAAALAVTTVVVALAIPLAFRVRTPVVA